MNKTAERFLVYGSLGAGLALLLTRHYRWSMMVAAVAPATFASQHPKAAWKAVRAAPSTVATVGNAAGKAVEKAVDAAVETATAGFKWATG